MALKAHRFMGLAKDVWLPDHYIVKINIVPSWRTNIRSNTAATAQTFVTIHSTGNWAANANAQSEANYLLGGAGGRYVGYNFAVHKLKTGQILIIQLTPLDEVTWAAGTQKGNTSSWHIEKAVGGVCDFDGTNEVAARLAGALAVAKGLDPIKAVVQHYVWYGKNCPQLVRERGKWGTIINLAADSGELAAAFLQATTKTPVAVPIVTTPTTTWDYEDPLPIKSLVQFEHATEEDMDAAPQEIEDITLVFDTYEVVNETPRYHQMVVGGAKTGPNLNPKTRLTIWGLKDVDGESWGITPAPYWTRVMMKDLKRISDKISQ